jgi:hypothetical protein
MSVPLDDFEIARSAPAWVRWVIRCPEEFGSMSQLQTDQKKTERVKPQHIWNVCCSTLSGLNSGHRESTRMTIPDLSLLRELRRSIFRTEAIRELICSRYFITSGR